MRDLDNLGGHFGLDANTLLERYPILDKSNRSTWANNKTYQDYVYARIVFHLANEIKTTNANRIPLVKLANQEALN